MTEERRLINGGKAHILTNEDRSKGGSTITPQKRLASLLAQSKKAKCGNCKAMCILKSSNPKSTICPIPECRAKAIFYNGPVMDKGILLKLSHETLMTLQAQCKTNKDLKSLHSAQMEQLKTEHPEIQKSINMHGIQGEVTVKIVREDSDDEKETK